MEASSASTSTLMVFAPLGEIDLEPGRAGVGVRERGAGVVLDLVGGGGGGVVHRRREW